VSTLRDYVAGHLSGPEADSLIDKIARRSAKVCVVGLGYVGLTVSCALARVGFRVIGIDTDAAKVTAVKSGRYPLDGSEPELPTLLAEQVRGGRLVATDDYLACARADVIVIVVQTPVDPVTRSPALTALHDAVQSVGRYLKPGTLVLVESTVPPGTMRGEVVPMLEQASGLSAVGDFFAGCCPERVMPGKLLANLGTCSRVMGGLTPQAGRVGAAFYHTLTTGDVDVTDCLTAEMVKTAENAYRDVQIAFANEVALLCEDYGADVYQVRTLVNKSPHRDMHLPGAGVGGHCIPKDPWLLVANAASSTPIRLIPAARAVNDSMPRHVGELTRGVLAEHGRDLAAARIVLLGYAYLENSDDVRNSPTADLVDWLHVQAASVVVHDPHVPGLQCELTDAARGADCLVLMVGHNAYRDLDLGRLAALMRTRTLVDGRHLFRSSSAAAAGLSYRCIGTAW
jgi:UDP-N-acetyl-D-mannosaminuronic acid dehydrogenase